MSSTARLFQQKDPPKRWPLRWRLTLITALALLIYFGSDALIPLIEHGGHMLLESMEMLIEEFYEHVLHMPRRQAEIFTVWSGVALILLVLYRTLRALVRRAIETYIAIHDKCVAMIASFNAWRHELSEADIAILSVAGIVVFFMLLSLL